VIPEIGRSAPPILGLDVGGVLVARAAGGADTSFFGSRPMGTPATAGAADAVRELVGIFGSRVHIVSKAGPRIEALSRAWLARNGFVGEALVAPDHLHFVTTRSDKGPVCAALGVTHFVDDRLDVLEHLTTVPHRLLFTGGLGDQSPPARVPETVQTVATWTATVALLRDLVGKSAPPADLD